MKKICAIIPKGKMEDFDLLEKIIGDFELEDTSDVEDSQCQHIENRIERGMQICTFCGFSAKVNDGQTYTSHKMYKRSYKTNNIANSLEQKGFDSRVIVMANKIYNIIVDKNSKRTGNRSSIICACIFQAFKILGMPVDYTYVYTKYNIKKKSALKGLKIVNTEMAKRKTLDIHDVICAPIRPEDFILSYMEEFKAPPESVEEVLRIYDQIKDSKEINMSRPQSIAAGVTLYWLKSKGMNDAIKIIEQKSRLSRITISKKAKVISLKIQDDEDAEAANALLSETP